jgi:hypothetical protein
MTAVAGDARALGALRNAADVIDALFGVADAETTVVPSPRARAGRCRGER